MGVLYDYFAAPTDADAAAVLDRVSGPGQPAAASQTGPASLTVSDTGIDPVVQGGTLEELLTGRPYAEIEQDPRCGQLLAMRDGGERLVLTLTDGLVDALAGADAGRLATVAIPWSQTEEFWGAGDPTALAAVLEELASLAREARSAAGSVYCWVCV